MEYPDGRSSLEQLADPRRLHEPVALDDTKEEDLRAMLRAMILIRRAEETIGRLVDAGEIRCPCHLAIGQEACAVGITAALDLEKDRVFGAHRSHGHYLSLGASTAGLFSEVFGKADGCSGGMGGSMHLIATERGLLGTVPIVGATVPMACGAALAAKMDGRGGAVVSFFGDGAAEEGVVQESLNLAATHSLPVLFACENNLFSSHMHISLRQPTDRVARYADAHRIPAATVDGNDVLAIRRIATTAVERARAGRGPTFIEMVTYRWRGHVGPREDLDVGVAREGDLPLWKKRDPISRFAESLKDAGFLDEPGLSQIEAQVEKEIQDALDRARAAVYPDSAVTLRYVYQAPEE